MHHACRLQTNEDSPGKTYGCPSSEECLLPEKHMVSAQSVIFADASVQ